MIDCTYTSDLFFNHQHDHMDEAIELLRREEKEFFVDHKRPEVREALLKDAVEFAALFEGACGRKLEPQDLVEDFINRV